jgi:hypothetical protein
MFLNEILFEVIVTGSAIDAMAVVMPIAPNRDAFVGFLFSLLCRVLVFAFLLSNFVTFLQMTGCTLLVLGQVATATLDKAVLVARPTEEFVGQ